MLCGTRKATVVGTPGPDRLQATRRLDVVAARGGDDRIEGISDDDWVCAGTGDDVVRSDSTQWARLVDLGPGDDRLQLLEATDVLGGTGDDRIVVREGSGSLSGGPGDDYLHARSGEVSFGYPDDAPCLTYVRARRGVHVDLTTQRSRREGADSVIGFRCVLGSQHDDVVRGTDSQDYVELRSGADVVHAGSADDSVDGGNGDDRLYLGDGNDYAMGWSGRDRLYGEAGADTLEGWTESDYLQGGSGNDQVYGAVFCAFGGNSYETDGKLDGAPDELFGGDGSDYLVGDQGNDRIDGGADFDWAQPGHRDGRIDWVEDVEAGVDGCLENVEFGEPLDPSRVRDVRPW